MMKKTAVVLLFTLFSGVIMSQSIYFRAGTGYGLPIATAPIGQNQARSEISNNTGNTVPNTIEGVNASYGSGMDFNFALGYKINENFMFDLNFQYLIGRKYKTSDTYYYSSGSFIENDYDNTTTSSKGFFINPSIIFSAGFGKAAPYGRFGLFTGSPTVTGERSDYYNGDGISTNQSRWEYTKAMAIGFQGAVGMNWKITEKMDFFTELNFISMTYYAGQYELTQNISNGTDNLANMPISQKIIVFKKKFDLAKVNNDPSKPSTSLRESTPFSSISLQVGIRFALWKMAE